MKFEEWKRLQYLHHKQKQESEYEKKKELENRMREYEDDYYRNKLRKSL